MYLKNVSKCDIIYSLFFVCHFWLQAKLGQVQSFKLTFQGICGSVSLYFYVRKVNC
jgi:hypothetical protein